MAYLKWLLYMVFEIPIMLIAYITNPIVILFADDDGELPKVFKLWQTWDDSCNPNDVYDNKQIPSCFLFDYYKHYKVYEGTTDELKAVNRTRWFSKCIDNDFTFKERIQRYFYRWYWLTRNCSYGFAFWLFGATIDADKVITESKEDFKKITGEGIFTIADSRKLGTILNYTIRWNNYLGWKVGTNYHGLTRFMIAHRIAFEIKK